MESGSQQAFQRVGFLRGEFPVRVDPDACGEVLHRQLVDQESFYRKLLDHVPCITYIYDLPGGRNIFSNNGMTRLLGYAPEDVRALDGEGLDALFHPEDLPRVKTVGEEIYNSAPEQNGPWPLHYRLRRSDGSYRWFQDHVVVISRDNAGHARLLLGSAVDIDDRVRDAADLREAMEKLHRKIDESEAFYHTASHDLKTPVTTIQLFVGSLRRELARGRDEHVQEFLDGIEGAAEQLGQGLRGLLTLSQLSGAPGRAERVDLEELAAEAIRNHRAIIEARAATVEVVEPLPTVRSDRERLEHLLHNLLNNALVHGCDRAGRSVQIVCHRDDRHVNLGVRDDGPGLPADQHERAFGVFERCGSRGGGSGVGLSIVRRVAEAIGGRAWIESPRRDLGRGAAVWVALPVGLLAEQG